MNHFTPLALAASLTFLANLGYGQSVIVVDDQMGPGVHFTSLTAALNSALDGDVVLVKPGDYYGDVHPLGGLRDYRIDGKSIDLVGDTGGPIRLRDSFFSVQNLGPTQHVSVTGIEFTDASFAALNCQGSVVVSRCRFPAFGSFSSSPSPKRMLIISGTETFVLENSWIEGRQTSNAFGTAPGDAIDAEGSNLFLYNSTVLGGKGNVGKQGGRGLRLTNSSLFASGGMILGGQAGDKSSFSGICSTPGAGITILPGSVVETVNVRVGGGQTGNFCTIPTEGCAPAIEGALTALTITQEVPHHITATSPVREGGVMTIGATGQNHEFVFLALSAKTDPFFQLALSAMSFVDLASYSITTLGSITSSAEELYAFPVPLMPIGIDATVLTAQLLFADTMGKASVRGMARVVLLDSKY